VVATPDGDKFNVPRPKRHVSGLGRAERCATIRGLPHQRFRSFPIVPGELMSDSAVTQLLDRIGAGDLLATDALLPVVYDQLRRLAAARLAGEAPGHTLQATALVHEAWLRLVGDEAKNWDHRGHFFAAAAEAMRRILVESARRKQRLKHGGGWQRVPEDALIAPELLLDDDVLAVDEALTEFAAESPDKAQLVKLRYFAGLSENDAAAALGISRATAARWWAYARAWLYDRLHSEE
jgi:RNA polymerase sigma factor (TIGR02999 family)